jgi:hypothetical protein
MKIETNTFPPFHSFDLFFSDRKIRYTFAFGHSDFSGVPECEVKIIDRCNGDRMSIHLGEKKVLKILDKLFNNPEIFEFEEN